MKHILYSIRIQLTFPEKMLVNTNALHHIRIKRSKKYIRFVPTDSTCKTMKIIR